MGFFSVRGLKNWWQERDPIQRSVLQFGALGFLLFLVLLAFATRPIIGLHYALEKDDSEEAKKILEVHPELLNRTGGTTRPKLTPLQRAVYRGNTEMVNFLLVKGADINLTTQASYPPCVVTANGILENFPSSFRPIMISIRTHRPEITKLLKRRGAVLSELDCRCFEDKANQEECLQVARPVANP